MESAALLRPRRQILHRVAPAIGSGQVGGPIDRAQHELLMLVAAPLIALERPLVPVLWALPRGVRVRALRGNLSGTQ